MLTKRINIIHKEPNEECFEILKSVIVSDEVLKTYRIDKNTLIQNLPEGVVNSFLDFISGFTSRHLEIVLKLIKEGKLIIDCTDE